MKLSVIIPVYNEEKTIAKVLKRLQAVVLDGIQKEIIVVDDGSSDRTVAKIKDQISPPKADQPLDGNVKNIRLLAHKKNLGKGAAVKSGIKAASGDYIIIQDADLEYDPKYIPILLKPILGKKISVVFGTRLDRMPDFKKEEKRLLFKIHYFGNRFLSLVTSILYGQWITDMETGYKVFPKKAADSFNLQAKSFDFEPEITAKLLKSGLKILEIPITTKPRGYKEGKKLHAGKEGVMALWTLFKYRFYD